jgi:hypothetical protein
MNLFISIHHGEKTAKVFKVYSTHLDEAIQADLRDQLAENHFRSAWLYLESRSESVKISGKNQGVGETTTSPQMEESYSP